ncbi:MAG: hypothetical protein WC873_02820 [Candidatus Gracilibacteria bacterium]
MSDEQVDKNVLDFPDLEGEENAILRRFYERIFLVSNFHPLKRDHELLKQSPWREFVIELKNSGAIGEVEVNSVVYLVPTSPYQMVVEINGVVQHILAGGPSKKDVGDFNQASPEKIQFEILSAIFIESTVNPLTKRGLWNILQKHPELGERFGKLFRSGTIKTVGENGTQIVVPGISYNIKLLVGDVGLFDFNFPVEAEDPPSSTSSASPCPRLW